MSVDLSNKPVINCQNLPDDETMKKMEKTLNDLFNVRDRPKMPNCKCFLMNIEEEK